MVILAALLWSTGGLLIKSVSFGPTGITMWRSAFAALTLALWLRPRRGLPPGSGPLLVGLAVSYAIMLLSFVSATRLTTAANAIFLQYTAPLFVVILARLFFGIRPTRVDLWTLAAALVGMGLFFVGKLRPADGLGNALAILSGLSFAIFLVWLRHPRANSDLRIASMVLGNCLLVAALATYHATTGQAEIFLLSGRDLSILLFLGVVQIGLAYAAFEYGIARVGSLEASLLAMLEPMLNPVWVWLRLGEAPGKASIAGGALIVASLALRSYLGERGKRASGSP